MRGRHCPDIHQVPGTATHVGIRVYFSRFLLSFLVHVYIAATALLICHSGFFFYPVFNEYWNLFGSTIFALVSPNLAGLLAHQPINIISSHFGGYMLLFFQLTGIFLLCYSLFRVVRAITLRAFQFLQFLHPI